MTRSIWIKIDHKHLPRTNSKAMGETSDQEHFFDTQCKTHHKSTQQNK